ncbi:MAG TPA: hypothetical protein VMU81_29655 [Acetobacteraceae bacterium]|nr:hypothetical protein [Acetobacteraceae bacterium]
MLAAAIGAFLAAIEDRFQNLLKPLGLKQPIFDMAGNQVVELLHRDREALASGFALPRPD